MPSRLHLARRGALVATACLLSTSAAAEEIRATDPEPSRIAVEVGFDVASHYTFRGFSQESRGFIGQPWAELGVGLFEGEGAVATVDLFVGSWNSIHGNKTFATHSPSTWYESDLYFGLALGLSGGLEIGLGYTIYMSPSGAFDAIREVGLTAGFGLSLPADVDLELGAGIHIELDDTDARVLEIGLEASRPLFSAGGLDVTVSVPILFGLDLGGYYGDDVFGFADAGLRLAAPLAFVPAGFGEWEIFGGVHYVRLGTEAAASSLPFVAEGSRGLVYAATGIALSR